MPASGSGLLTRKSTSGMTALLILSLGSEITLVSELRHKWGNSKNIAEMQADISCLEYPSLEMNRLT